MTALATGDLVFFRCTGPISAFIRLGQWLRPSTRPWCAYTHCVMATGDEDWLICSELCARALMRTGMTFRHNPAQITPALLMCAMRQPERTTHAER